MTLFIVLCALTLACFMWLYSDGRPTLFGALVASWLFVGTVFYGLHLFKVI